MKLLIIALTFLSIGCASGYTIKEDGPLGAFAGDVIYVLFAANKAEQQASRRNTITNCRDYGYGCNNQTIHIHNLGE